MLQQSIGRLCFIRPDVAVVDVDAAVTGYLQVASGGAGCNDGALRAKLQLVVTREDEWMVIAAYHNVDVKPMPLRRAEYVAKGPSTAPLRMTGRDLISF